ncbi:MAG: hypothetical protein C0173_03410 [Desulfurella sp.]|uniref:hypothetical protein n=1 Tax=Desulfurella sp. TaxID=1962857 RepID=UPI000CACDD0A|nr:hypothetical protein [Desulfurella sp.]PMP91477.1 MAG: hypothetical protein C0173_03410 [Desulfurella sp.]
MEQNISKWKKTIMSIIGIVFILAAIENGRLLFFLFSILLILLVKRVFHKKDVSLRLNLLAIVLTLITAIINDAAFDFGMILGLTMLLFLKQGLLWLALFVFIFMIIYVKAHWLYTTAYFVGSLLHGAYSLLIKIPFVGQAIHEVIHEVLELFIFKPLYLIGVSFGIKAIFFDMLGIIGLILLISAILDFPFYEKINLKMMQQYLKQKH